MAEEDQRIIVDSDWKQEAQKEKERLEEASRDLGTDQLPAPAFAEIINMIAMQAMVGLGGLKTPDGKQIPADLHVAKHHVDLLEVLQEKTKGNLDERDQTALDATLHELRLAFVHMAGGQGAAPPDTADPS